MGTSRESSQILKESVVMETSRDFDRKKGFEVRFCSCKIIHWLSFSKKQISVFGYQCIISTKKTYGLRHDCFQGIANLYRLCWLWKMSGQIWTILSVQECFQLLRCKTQSFQERRQQRFWTSTKSYNGRVRLQPIHAIEESAGHCSRKLWRVQNLFPVQITTIFRSMDEQLKLAHKVIDVVDRANKIIFRTMLWYNMDRPQGSYAQFCFFSEKKQSRHTSANCFFEH